MHALVQFHRRFLRAAQKVFVHDEPQYVAFVAIGSNGHLISFPYSERPNFIFAARIQAPVGLRVKLGESFLLSAVKPHGNIFLQIFELFFVYNAVSERIAVAAQKYVFVENKFAVVIQIVFILPLIYGGKGKRTGFVFFRRAAVGKNRSRARACEQSEQQRYNGYQTV